MQTENRYDARFCGFRHALLIPVRYGLSSACGERTHGLRPYSGESAGNFSVCVANPDGAISTNITFAVAGGTTPFIHTVYNPANQQPVLTPGAPTFLEGLRLATDTFSAFSAPWPTSMGGVHVTINGIPAPLRFVSPTAIVFQVPQKLTAAGSVVVSAPSGVSTPFTVAFANVSFGVVANSPDTQRAPAVHGSGLTLVSASKPIVPGETVTMFGVGAGVPSCSFSDGAAPVAACPTQAPEIQLPDVDKSSAPRATASLVPGNLCLSLQCGEIGNPAPPEALAREQTDFDLRLIQPATVLGRVVHAEAQSPDSSP